MAEDLRLHSRVSRLEEWKEQMQTIDLPSMRETIKREIPDHYTKKIEQSEANTMLRIEKLIDARLKVRFGWLSQLILAVGQAVLVVIALKALGLAG